MPKRLGLTAHLISVLALALLVTGCPKRPNVPVAAAPAPVAEEAVAPVPAPAQPAPAPAPAPPAEFAPDDNLKDVYFDFDKSAIRAGDGRTLEASAAYLKANPRVIVLVEGHCDERGTGEYNLALGQRRLTAAIGHLVAQGIDKSRFTGVSYGEERPFCAERTEACWAKNRRAHFLSKLQ
jgi:peptidoglycan-associated lipoprotein